MVVDWHAAEADLVFCNAPRAGVLIGVEPPVKPGGKWFGGDRVWKTGGIAFGRELVSVVALVIMLALDVEYGGFGD